MIAQDRRKGFSVETENGALLSFAMDGDTVAVSIVERESGPFVTVQLTRHDVIGLWEWLGGLRLTHLRTDKP